MKKFKIIVGMLIRGMLILVPGAAGFWWMWGKAPAFISILASVGVESVFLVLFAFISLAVTSAKDLKQKKAEKPSGTL